MAVKNYEFNLSTEGFTDIIDISAKVHSMINNSGIKNGIVVIACPSSTSAITTIEYESGCIQDLQDYYEKVAPMEKTYQHNLRWGDGNGYAHVRSAISKPNLSFPIVNGDPVLGTWQQIVFVDFDNRPRNRKIVVQIVGE